jgi:Putative transposase
MALTSSGQVRYTLKTPYRDGATHIVLEPLDLMARLAALVPAPDASDLHPVGFRIDGRSGSVGKCPQEKNPASRRALNFRQRSAGTDSYSWLTFSTERYTTGMDCGTPGTLLRMCELPGAPKKLSKVLGRGKRLANASRRDGAALFA